MDWLINFHDNGRPGLVLTGPDAVRRCMAIAAALVRNFIDARVRTVDQMLDDPVEATVLLCPNFHLIGSKTMPGWRIQKLYDLLLERYTRDLPTVVWVDSLLGVKDYGMPVYDMLSSFRQAKSKAE